VLGVVGQTQNIVQHLAQTENVNKMADNGTSRGPNIQCELSRLSYHGHSQLLSSYLCRKQQKENFSCNDCGHQLQDLTHLLLDCPASEPLRRAIFGTTATNFDLKSTPWGVARMLGFRGITPRPHP